MPVFLSHKREDSVRAVEIARYLEAHQVKCYVDVIDTAVGQTTSQAYCCRALLAVLI
jgi:hypothetical protein